MEMDTSAFHGNGSSSYEDKMQPDPDSVKMFVGQIPRTSTEEELRTLFEEFGNVYELTILRDKNTGASKGCCFVTFYTRDAALNAQKSLNNVRKMPGMHNAIQMKPADSEKRNLEDRKLFVGMLPKNYVDTDVRQLFQGLGAIDECTILRDSEGNSKGCAFVTMATRQCSVNAIRLLNQSRTLEGAKKPLVVKLADSQQEKDMKKIHQHGGPIGGPGAMGGAFGAGNSSQYVTQMMQQAMNAAGMMGGGAANTPGMGGANAVQQKMLMNALMQIMQTNNGDTSNVTMAALLALLAPALGGNANTSQMLPLLQQLISTMSPGASSSQLPQNIPPIGGNPPIPPPGAANSGFNLSNPNPTGGSGGMSAFDALAQAYSGMQQYNASSIGQQGNAGLSSTMPGVIGNQTEGPEGANLFIYHLPQEFSDHDLLQIFSPFGTIISAKVFIDKLTNTSKCFGFVSYETAASAQAAIQAMNGFQMGTRRLKVQLKRPKNDSKPY